MKTNSNLTITLAKIKLNNPVMMASGTFGYGKVYKDLIDLDELGAIVTKTITLEPRTGNAPPRTVETASGMLNAIGLQNAGIDDFLSKKLPELMKMTKTPVIVSIGGKSVEEFVKLAKRLNSAKGIAAIEVNISCPNVKVKSKCMFAQDAKSTLDVTRRIKKISKYPVIVKLSPNVTDIKEIARAAERGGADAISLVNTFTGLSIDINSKAPRLANITGGLSGPAIKPLALKLVWEAAGAVKIPVIGMGGIMNAADALEFLIAGASAVVIGTANFVDPGTYRKVLAGISKYMQEKKIKNLKSLIGSLKCPQN
ncbi:MAG: dihydroorotate dehydrogenase [bacterium]